MKNQEVTFEKVVTTVLANFRMKERRWISEDRYTGTILMLNQLFEEDFVNAVFAEVEKRYNEEAA